MSVVRMTACRLGVLTFTLMIASGCPRGVNPHIRGLVAELETVQSWRRSLEGKQHTAWFKRVVAWDIVFVVGSAWAATDPDRDEPIDPLLRTGLDHVAAGSPEEQYIPSLVNGWRQYLGDGVCRIVDLTTDDQAWLKRRLALPALKDISADTTSKLAAYAKRGSEAHDFVRIECGKEARLLVGTLGDRIVPILRE